MQFQRTILTLSKSLRFAMIFVAIGIAVGVGVSLALAPSEDDLYQRVVEDADNPWLDSAYLKSFEDNLRIGSHYKSNLSLGEEGFFRADAKGGQKPYLFQWKFSDGAVLTEQNVTRTFDSIGNYTVELTVTDSSQGPQTKQQLISIEIVSEP